MEFKLRSQKGKKREVSQMAFSLVKRELFTLTAGGCLLYSRKMYGSSFCLYIIITKLWCHYCVHHHHQANNSHTQHKPLCRELCYYKYQLTQPLPQLSVISTIVILILQIRKLRHGGVR